MMFGSIEFRYNARRRTVPFTMQQNTAYPQWYRTFRGFVFGTAVGALLMVAAIASSESPANGLAHFYLWPAIINAALFAILGTFEAVFAIRRHRRLVIELRNRATSS
jgi:branched-subunit amino acid transport protein